MIRTPYWRHYLIRHTITLIVFWGVPSRVTWKWLLQTMGSTMFKEWVNWEPNIGIWGEVWGLQKIVKCAFHGIKMSFSGTGTLRAKIHVILLANKGNFKGKHIQPLSPHEVPFHTPMDPLLVLVKSFQLDPQQNITQSLPLPLNSSWYPLIALSVM